MRSINVIIINVSNIYSKLFLILGKAIFSSHLNNEKKIVLKLITFNFIQSDYSFRP